MTYTAVVPKLPNIRKSVTLEELVRRSSERAWEGKGGLTDRDVYRSLVETAHKHGRVRPEGIEVRISVRELSRKARVGYRATLRSLNDRLIPAGLVERSAGGWGTQSGALVLLVGDDVIDYQERSAFDINVSNAVPKFRWGAGKLGKFAGSILETIYALGPCTRPQIAKVLGRKSRDIKGTLNRLVESGLVDRDGVVYSLPTDFEDVLEERFLSDGTAETDRKHEALYEKEREAYRSGVVGQGE
jgi:hypothetical protein